MNNFRSFFRPALLIAAGAAFGASALSCANHAQAGDFGQSWTAATDPASANAVNAGADDAIAIKRVFAPLAPGDGFG